MADTEPLTPGTIETVETPASEPVSIVNEKAMGEIFDRLTAAPDAEGESKKRGSDGRFVAKESAAPASADQAGTDQSGAEDAGDQPLNSERQVQPSALPPNWPKDKADAFTAIPENLRAPVQEVLQGLHAKMSDQGRALASYRDLDPIFADMRATYPQHFSGEQAKTTAQVVNYLYGWQKAMDADPLKATLAIAENYNIIPQLVAHFTQAGQQGQQQPTTQPAPDVGALLKQIEQRVAAQLAPERLEQQITSVMTKSQTQDAISRFAAEKPFWAEVESHIPDFIRIAKVQQPDAAPLALLEAAYDMAINAIPATRTKAIAAAPAAVAKEADAKRVAGAKAANQLNVKTTGTGKQRPKSDEEVYGEAWDRAMSAA